MYFELSAKKVLEWGHSFKVLIGHQVKYFLSVFRKIQVKFPCKVDWLAIITIFFHSLMHTQLVVSVSASLEEILYTAFEGLCGLHLTVVA